MWAPILYNYNNNGKIYVIVVVRRTGVLPPYCTVLHAHCSLCSPEAITRRPYFTVHSTGTMQYINGRHLSWAPGVFYSCFYNHAHRLRLENLYI